MEAIDWPFRAVHNRPQMVLDRVGAALVDRGCPKTW